MEIISGLHRVKDTYKRCVLTIGIFDGVHRGHQAIIRETVRRARRLRRKAVALTFDVPPRIPGRVGRNQEKRFLLSTAEEKIGLIESLGVDLLVILRFTRRLINVAPGEFIKKLALNLEPSQIVVGSNHTFGRGAKGTPALLRSLGKSYGFRTVVFNLRRHRSHPINSTAIRNLVRKGEIQRANLLLGRRFSVQGRVVHGSRRGTSLGFPTANLKIHPHKILPACGVYAGIFSTGDKRYPGAINVGTRPTFPGGTKRPVVEVFVMGFKGNLYGHAAELEFVKRIRSEKKFANREALRMQISEDLKKTNSILKGYSNEFYQAV